MAYAPHLYAQWSGTLPAGEVWSSGTRFRHLGGGDVTWQELQSWLNSIKDEMEHQFTLPASGIPIDARLTSLKLNWITATGHYRDLGHTAQISWHPGPSANVQPFTPGFTTTAISLLTGVSAGRAHRGRQYWPNNGLALDTLDPPLVNPGARNGALAWYHQVLAIICNGVPDGDPNPAKTFQQIVASEIDGTVRDVTQFAMGSVLDVQRKRKNAYPEQYVTLSAAV